MSSDVRVVLAVTRDTTPTALGAALRKELLLQWRTRGQFMAVFVFGAAALLLFSFAIGPSAIALRTFSGGFLWLGLVGTGLAYYCWFLGLRTMPAGVVSLIGLVNPVVGTLLGVAFAGELFGWAQALGMALVLGGVLAGQPAVHAALRGRRGRGARRVGTVAGLRQDTADDDRRAASAA